MDLKKGRAPTVGFGLASVTLFLIASTGCDHRGGSANTHGSSSTLTVGYPLLTGNAGQDFGAAQAARNVTLEQLVTLSRNGRPVPSLAEGWSESEDGLSWRVQLRPGVTFHNGKPVNAEIVRDILAKGLQQNLGPAFDDVDRIRAVSDREIELTLKRPSAFLMEGLDVNIEAPGSPGVGTGPFLVSAQTRDRIEMRANEKYYRGRPSIDRITLKLYDSIRPAWADLLRGRVDMLYDVGLDALDSLEPSAEVKIFTYRRAYAYIALINVRKRQLQDRSVRRKLNAAIDRPKLIADGLDGHGIVAEGPVWPNHWAAAPGLPGFTYQPQPIGDDSHRLHLTCLFPDSYVPERLALAFQRQLQAVGVELELDALPLDGMLRRIQSGDFDLVLTDMISGPTLARPYLFWHTAAPFNWGHFSSSQVDAALDSIRHARNEGAYKAGVIAFQRAIVDDPPAIFLAWTELARAVSRRFYVPAEPGQDVWRTLRLWRPLSDERASRN